MAKDIKGEYLQFGGMAVPEGVMMRSPNYYSVACRAPSGQIVVKTEPLDKTFLGKLGFLKKPFLHGSLAMLDTMALGMRAMHYASDVQLAAEAASSTEKAPSKAMTNAALLGAVVVSLGFGFFVFKVLPESTAQWIRPGSVDREGIGTNYLAELIKIVLFIGYLSLIRLYPPIMEVFRYHGAEHKAINVVEASEQLTPANALAQTRLHHRCGTNFAIVVLIIGLLIFPLIPRFGHGQVHDVLVVLMRLGVEICILPLIAGISYEVIRAAGKAKDQKWVNILLKPGLATQLITTAEPAQGHVEVAIASLESVMKAEETGETLNVELDLQFGKAAEAT